MKIVQFENGKYGVRIYWLFRWHFASCSIYASGAFYDPEEIQKYCQLKTFEEAKKLLLIRQNKYKIIKINNKAKTEQKKKEDV